MYMRILYMRILGGQQVEPQRSGELWGRSGELWACFEDALESSGDALWTSGGALGSSGEALGKLWGSSGEALGSFGNALGTISGTPRQGNKKGAAEKGHRINPYTPKKLSSQTPDHPPLAAILVLVIPVTVVLPRKVKA